MYYYLSVIASLIVFVPLQTKANNINNSTDLECELKTGMLLAYFINGTKIPDDYHDVYKFYTYSGKNLNDLGDYLGCKSISNISNYIYVSYSLSLKPLTNISLGICYFKECNATYYQKAEHTIINIIEYFTNKTNHIRYLSR